jgi:hypothetical protein
MARGQRTQSGSDDHPRITGLSVLGFKSISDKTRIDLRRLTILAGANSSSAEQFLSRSPGKGSTEMFEIEIDMVGRQHVALVFSRDPKEIVTIERMSYESDNDKRRISLWPKMTERDIDQQLAGDEQFQSFRRVLSRDKQNELTHLKVARNRCFLQVEISTPTIGERLGLAMTPAGALPGLPDFSSGNRISRAFQRIHCKYCPLMEI